MQLPVGGSAQIAKAQEPLARTLPASIIIVAMYRGSCLFHPSRSSGLSGCGHSYMIVLCSLSLKSNTRTLPAKSNRAIEPNVSQALPGLPAAA